MKHTRILSLDLATTTGFARLANGVFDAGHVKFSRKTGRKNTRDDHEGIVFHQFSCWLGTMIRDDCPTFIVYERAGHFPSAAAAYMACGLRGILMAQAAFYGIPLATYSPLTLKKWATGTGKAEKPAMLAAARKLAGGEDLADHNAADALIMLHHHLAVTK
jgi:Holliday junction resolvasome RuvABC endonuclease subunit